MPRVVTSACDGCKFTDCVTVCPVDCFHEGATTVYIDPVTCIDCDACVPQCPVSAIYEESAVPESEKKWIAVNAEESKKTPVIKAKKDPLPGAMDRKAALEAAAAAPAGGGPGGGGTAAPKGPSPAELEAKRKKDQEERKKREEERARIAALKKERLSRFVASVVPEKDRIDSERDDEMERDRRYGRVYWLEETPQGYLLRLELPRVIPAARQSEAMGLAGAAMPDYRWEVQRPAADLLVVRAWVDDPKVQSLVGRIGSFPYGFTREIRLPRPVASHEGRCRDRALEVDLKTTEGSGPP